MAENSKIEWTDHTFNPWTGCQAVSSACAHCYAEMMDKRFGHANRWGPHGVRVRTSSAYWKQPLRWNKEAAASGVRRRVFCASMADVFDTNAPTGARAELFTLIENTPALDWLLLTKRPQNIARMVQDRWARRFPSNVWLGTTAENQEEANRRIPHLLLVPAKVRFLSCEPLLGPIDLTRIEWPRHDAWPRCDCQNHAPTLNVLNGTVMCEGCCEGPEAMDRCHVHWVIAGGESGHGARPMHPDWARDLRDQCADAEVPFFFKQWGEWGRPTTAADYAAVAAGESINAALTVSGAFADRGNALLKVGKKAAGALLDHSEHREFPHAG